jgi:hypothetical protein
MFCAVCKSETHHDTNGVLAADGTGCESTTESITDFAPATNRVWTIANEGDELTGTNFVRITDSDNQNPAGEHWTHDACNAYETKLVELLTWTNGNSGTLDVSAADNC